ncbi:MAG: DUF4058 family protein [Planctomycetaceae bacterium]|nr:DUF4058 family protein [Planctomycetaceae bacterium]
MKSPFPGMDPYIEACDYWGDFHDKLISEIERELSSRISRRYVVRLANRTYIELTDSIETSSLIIPDVGIVRRKQRQHKQKPRSVGDNSGVGVLEQPVMMRALTDIEYNEPYLEVYEAGQPCRLITAIEVLSPANKRLNSVGWRQYVHKRQVFLNGAANFVEVDLLRGGERMPMSDEWPDSPYYLLVSRKNDDRGCQVWPTFAVRPVPEIPIPLLPRDLEIPLRLQPLINEIYRRSRYAIDYRLPISLPLSEDERLLITQRSKPSRRSTRN